MKETHNKRRMADGITSFNNLIDETLALYRKIPQMDQRLAEAIKKFELASRRLKWMMR